MKVFSHDTSGGLFFTPDDALNKNPDNPNAKLFSILSQMEKYRNAEGNFHLKLCYPDVSTGADGKRCNEWIQSSSPVTQASITGFKPLSISFKNSGTIGHDFGGLAKSDSNHALIDDTGSNQNWWSAIGATKYAPPQATTIPGPRPIKIKKVVLNVHQGKFS